MNKKLFSLVMLGAAFALQAALPPLPSGKASKVSAASAASEIKQFNPEIKDGKLIFGNKEV